MQSVLTEAASFIQTMLDRGRLDSLEEEQARHLLRKLDPFCEPEPEPANPLPLCECGQPAYNMLGDKAYCIMCMPDVD